MAYMPELSMKESAALRRIAWALDVPMTVAIVKVFEHVADAVDAGLVCKACKDKKCDGCYFERRKP